MSEMCFFLGANTCRGFYSLYDEYIGASAPIRIWILKGGAGCGKSSFLRIVGGQAAAAGYTVHRILCSGDPASLDGIHIQELNVLLFDGTSPHVLEPPLVGHTGFYLDLSRFYLPGVPDLQLMEEAYKEHYRRAYRWLSAAGDLGAVFVLSSETQERIRRKAVSLITRELRRQNRKAHILYRMFTDAFTCDGVLSLPETRRAIAPRIISVHGICGADACFLNAAAEAALARGWDTILCPDPLNPEHIAHVLIPECGLGLSVGAGDRRIHLERYVYAAEDKEEAKQIRETEAMRTALLTRARSELLLAKQHHDRLEEAVNHSVDFNGVYAMAEDFAQKLLGGAAAPDAGQV